MQSPFQFIRHIGWHHSPPFIPLYLCLFKDCFYIRKTKKLRVCSEVFVIHTILPEASVLILILLF